jgi:pimeloyl-ACP methyl ester carboxylesterase
MTAFVLIHGTYAKGAAWTKGGSPIRKTIEEACLEKKAVAEFVTVEWSGKNTISDRIRAAETLMTVIKQLRYAEPLNKIVLIGHSHGGSIISYYLRRFGLDTPVDGAIFLSTPFLALRKMTGLDRRIVVHFYVFCVTTQVVAIFSCKCCMQYLYTLTLLCIS